MSIVERLARLVALLYGARFTQQVVEPIVADLQHETAGLTGARSRLAKQFGACWALLTAGLSYALTASRPSARLLIVFAASTTVMTFAIAWLTFPQFLGHQRPLVLYIHLLPQALSTALVAGFGIALGVVGRTSAQSRRAQLLVWGTALSVALLVAMTLQTITPAHNQAFREMLFDGHPRRGANELTWRELFDQMHAHGPADFVQGATFPPAAFWFHHRLALVTLPVVLLLLHHSLRRRRTMLLFVAGVLVWWIVVPPSQITAAIAAGVPAALVAWLPNGALLVAAGIARRADTD